jgi:transcriptional regulator with XRE-family HTH domain
MDSASDTVAQNIDELRALRRLRTRGLAERLTDIGHPIEQSGVSKWENGRRRVNTDALLALALVLGCSPNRLLLPGKPTGPVALTPNVEVPWDTAWRWASGEVPILLGEKGVAVTDPRRREFIELSRPFERGGLQEAGQGLLARVAPGFNARIWHDQAAGRVRSSISWDGGEDGNGGDGAAA